jgi:uncharacterized protein YoxC
MFILFIVNTLIIIFVLMLIFQILFPVREGLENNDSSKQYQEYDLNSPNSSLILAQQNAGNIEYIKGRLLELDKVKQDVTDINGNLEQLTDNVEQLVQQQSEYSQQQLPSSPPEISGASYEETETEEEE